MKGDLHHLLARLPALRRRLLRDLVPNSCIESSRLLHLLLQQHGLPSQLTSVELTIKAPPVPGAPDQRAYLLKVGEPDHHPGKRTGGHLTVTCQGLLVDLSIDQVNNPSRGVRLEAPFVMRLPPGFERDGATALALREDELRIIYTHHPRNRFYLHRPAWRNALDFLREARGILNDPHHDEPVTIHDSTLL